MISVLIALKLARYNTLKSDKDKVKRNKAVPKSRKDLTNKIIKKQHLRDDIAESLYRSPTIKGTKYKIISLVVSANELDFIVSKLGTNGVIIAAFDYSTGLPWGKYYDGSVVKGSDKYPLHPDAAKFIFKDGAKVAAATAFTQQNRLSGQHDYVLT